MTPALQPNRLPNISTPITTQSHMQCKINSPSFLQCMRQKIKNNNNAYNVYAQWRHSTRKAGSRQWAKKISKAKRQARRNARQYCQQATTKKSTTKTIHTKNLSEKHTKIEAMVRVNLWRQFLFAVFCLTYTVFNFGCPCQRGVHKNAFVRHIFPLFSYSYIFALFLRAFWVSIFQGSL